GPRGGGRAGGACGEPAPARPPRPAAPAPHPPPAAPAAATTVPPAPARAPAPEKSPAPAERGAVLTPRSLLGVPTSYRSDLAPIDEPGFTRAHASPSVRRFARELGVNLAQVPGHGFKERITHEDVKAFVKGTLATPVASTATAAAASAGAGSSTGASAPAQARPVTSAGG